MKPVDVRRKLVHTLGLDLVGPDRDSELLDEILPQAPSRWYLTGFLVPLDAAEGQKIDEAATEEVDEASDGGGTDDAVAPEPAAARPAVFPSSMGLSFLVPKEAKELHVTVRWGDYQAPARLVAAQQGDLFEATEPRPQQGKLFEDGELAGWQRCERVEPLTVKLPASRKVDEDGRVRSVLPRFERLSPSQQGFSRPRTTRPARWC